MAATINLDQVPGPHALPIIGNLRDIDMDHPYDKFVEMAREYGPVYKLELPSGPRLMISDPDIVHEISDDAKFDKFIGPGLKVIQGSVAGTGLFTTDTDDPDWVRAHGILMAPFSQQAMRNYMPRMLDIAGQLMDKWSRLNPTDDVDVPGDMTSVTLDTIALCGFDYRFNSLHRETPHPFVASLVRMLQISQARTTRPTALNKLMKREQREAEDAQEYMRSLVQSLLDNRKAQGEGADNSDLLGVMLTGSDRDGVGLSEENIVAQCITFLVAGHETTSGLLSFAVYYLLKNRDIMERARAEADEVLGNTAYPTYEQVRKMTYVLQILEEALRLWAPAPMYNRAPREDAVLGGKYAVPAGSQLTVLIPALHRSEAVWGANAEEFDPDRMSVENQAQLPPDVYKPFGTGMRACIGRQFALQEATLIIGMLLQRFEFVDYTDYQLQVRQALTIKPDEFHIQVRRREGVTLEGAAPMLTATPAVSHAAEPVATVPLASRHGTPLYVLFGSNLGTAEGIATKLASEGAERGFAVTLGALDDHIGDLPTDGATLIVTASYNGTPPDNAAMFVKWLDDPTTPADACAGVSYAVFGCGDRAWTSTYQRIPTLVDAQLEAHGAERIHGLGEGNAAADFDEMYGGWHSSMWTDVVGALDLPLDLAEPVRSGPRLAVSTVNLQSANPLVMSYDAAPAIVLANLEVELTAPAEALARSVRHIEVALPAGTSYETGDHLGVMPRNSIDNIRRILRRFELDAGSYVTIVATGGSHTHLPTDEPTPLLAILGASVELQDVATRNDIKTLARYTDDADQQASLEALSGDDEASQRRFRERVSSPRRSVIELLEEHPDCRLPFAEYLDMLPPLRPRYYSISSSPHVGDPSVCSITAAVVRGPALDGDGVYHGVCTNYLETMAAHSTIFAFVRKPTIAFHPPGDASVPMIMVGAGTGMAPFRGFIQDRAAQLVAGTEIGPSMLLFGYREARDYLYREELLDYEKRGVVGIRTVISSQPVDGRKYVQHEIAERHGEIWDLIEQGAAIFVCGNAKTMAPGVRAAFAEIYRNHTGSSADEAQAWLAEMRTEGRFLEDIWGGGA